MAKWSIKNIVLSRFKKNQNEDWVRARRTVCATCPYKLTDKRTAKQKLLKYLSDFYTWITRADNEDLGECFCSCPIYFLTADPKSECSAKEEYGEDRWKSIYIPNKAQKEKWNK